MEVTYIDHMGSDLTVVNAARASFDKVSAFELSTSKNSYLGVKYQIGGPCKMQLKEADANLIRFLATGYRKSEWEELKAEILGGENLDGTLSKFKNHAQHWAPFAHPNVQLRLKMPIFLARQFVKHQVGGVWSEESRRYVNYEPEFWFPEQLHTRPSDVKQGSGDVHQRSDADLAMMKKSVHFAKETYMQLVENGVAPEEARMILPLNMVTTVVWTGSLLFWARVCNQRLDAHAQLAAQEFAGKISSIMRGLFPVSWEALVPASKT